MKCYHGTTLENAIKIIKGENKSLDTVWNCSQDNSIYVYPESKLDDADAGDDEYLEERGIQQAMESGFIATAFYGSSLPVVLCFDIPEELLKDDYSCENMDAVASSYDTDQHGDVNQYITKIAVSERYNAELRLLYLSWVTKNCNFNLDDLDDLLLKALKLAAQVDIMDIYDDLYDYEYRSETIENFKKDFMVID